MIDIKIKVCTNINKSINGEEIYRSATETPEMREMGDVKTGCSIKDTRLPDRIN